jgi:hypothetical protein
MGKKSKGSRADFDGKSSSMRRANICPTSPASKQWAGRKVDWKATAKTEPAHCAQPEGKTNVEFKAILRQTWSMATLSLTDEQVVQLVKQLPPQSKQRVLADLTAERDPWWQSAARDGEKDMRRLAAARGLDWDAMTEAQHEALVDDLLHES